MIKTTRYGKPTLDKAACRRAVHAYKTGEVTKTQLAQRFSVSVRTMVKVLAGTYVPADA